jgi:serine/threonine protein kinase/tetratricopeptide (TPR) repeat protein
METGLPRIGELVAGKYRITARLGEGGYGVVFRAFQETMGRDVAIKMLRPEAAAQADEVERFRREVFHASCLRHPNTITLYDYGQSPNGTLYIVMEYLEGLNLRMWLKRHGAAPPEFAHELLVQMLRSLREAHEQGIIHRDLKPENVYITELAPGERLIKVLDFGLSKISDHERPRRHPQQRTLTKEGQVFGTPQYMSPEQACGLPIGPTCDIYALGLVLWETLTGRTCFDGSSAVEVLLKQVNEGTPALPGALLNSTLDRFIQRATAKDTNQRFQTGREALAWLQEQSAPVPSPLMTPFTPQPAVVMGVVEAELPSVAVEPIAVARTSIEAAPQAPAQRGRADSMAQNIPTMEPQLDGAELDMRIAQMRMIGREDELRELIHWGQRALVTGGVLWITGDLGMGKSRLLDEWRRHMELHSPICLRGVHREPGAQAEGLREALRPLLAQEAARLHLPPNVIGFEELESLAQVLDGQTGGADGEQGQDWAVAVVERVFYTLARIRPTILILEDVHLADSFTLRLLEHWQEELSSRSLPLMLVFSRNTDEIAHTQQLNQLSRMAKRGAQTANYAHSVHLRALGEDDAHALLDGLLPLAPPLRRRVVKIARGNPLYLTQITSYLIEQQALGYVPERAHWDLAVGEETLAGSMLPPDLEALLMQRVMGHLRQHRLAAVLHAVVARAMLLGARFELRLLKEALRLEGRGDLEAYLDDAVEALTRIGVLVSTVIEGRPALEFTYEVLRQRLLASNVWRDEDWPALHQLAARAKIAHYEARRPQLLEAHAHEIAHHLVEAGQREEGHAWLMRAAQSAERTQDFRAALTHLRHAANLLDEEIDPNGERLLEIRLSEGRLFRNLGEFGPAEDALRGAIEESRRVGDEVGEALTSEALAGVLTLVTRHEEAAKLYGRIQRLYANFGDEAGQARCALGQAELAVFQGNYVQAHVWFEATLQRGHMLDDARIQMRAIFGLGRCAYAAGKLTDATRLYHQARRMAEQTGDALARSEADVELASVAIYNDHVENAVALAQQALEVKQSLGDTLGQAHAHLILGICLRRTLRIDQAMFHCQRARAINERLSHVYGIAKSVLLASEITWAKGEPDEALRALEDTLQLHESLEDAHGLILTLMHQSLCELETGRASEARQHLQRAFELIESHGIALYRAKCLTFLGMVHEAEGRMEEAVDLHDQALALAESQGHGEMASLAAISLARIHLMMGDLGAVKMEAPVALARAESVGHAHLLIFALSLQAVVARLDRDAPGVAMSVRRLRVLHSHEHGPDMRIPERIAQMAYGLAARQTPERAFAPLLAIVEILRALGAEQAADSVAARMMKRA